MKNTKSFILISFIGLYLILQFILSILHLSFWGNLLLPFGTFFAGVILFYRYLKCNRGYICKSICLIFSIASFIWMATDFIYFVFNLAGFETKNSFLYLLYPTSNFLLAAGCFLLSFYLFKQWNWLQFFLDSLVFTLCTFRLLWFILFDKAFSFDKIISCYGFFSVFSVLIDFMIIVSSVLWMINIRKSSRPRYIQIICLGASLFSIDNLWYCYLYLYGLYKPVSVVDILYTAAFIIIAMGSKMDTDCDSCTINIKDYDTYANRGKFKKVISLFLFPVVTTVFNGFIASELVMYVLMIGFYFTCTVYIQIAIKNENLLTKEKELNRTLEEKVRLRTGELIEKNKTLDTISKQDTVTKLYNRRYFAKALQDKMERIESIDNIVLFFIDLDRFKTINDTYGHLVGDEVLIEISKRLQLWNKENSILARLGGDEFVLAVKGRYGYRQAESLAEKIIKCCSEKIEIDEYIFRITMSVGISIYPIDALNINSLMKNADIAMYQAKAKGFNQYVSFNSSLEENNRRKNEIEMLLRRADFDKEFELYYQPQFQIPDGKLIGMETLLRWTTPEGEIIHPADFIPIAEEINYIVPIGEWVMKEAIRQIAKWNTTYKTQLKMGINVSPKQLDNKNFINALKNSVREYEVNSNWLDVEITENIAMEGKHRLTQVATMFNEMGISISIDDFGTGYSSLSYLKYFPFDRIKISKPLIDAICEHNYDLQIVKAIILLAKSIGIKTIAEGVETRDQLDILIQLECEEIQGFYFSQPLPPTEFEERFLMENRFRYGDVQELTYHI